MVAGLACQAGKAARDAEAGAPGGRGGGLTPEAERVASPWHKGAS